jgi:hypothetical protein
MKDWMIYSWLWDKKYDISRKKYYKFFQKKVNDCNEMTVT